jgi:DNA-binding NtrC family response regulator
MNDAQAAVPKQTPAVSGPMVGVVEDDPIMGESLVQRLQLEGYRTCWWQSGEEALHQLRDAGCHVLICDIRLPDLNGEQLFRRAIPDLGTTPVVFITAFGEVEQAVRLMRAGADDYLTKPFEIDALLHKVASFCTRQASAGCDIPRQQMLSASPAMRSVQLQLLRVKDGVSPVLLLGETGVGKEVAARQLHEASIRRDLPFVVVNCAALPADRAEIEMFGHERGAIPGSRMAQVGLVEQAGTGVLFLDEVSALPSSLQGKLLRLLEDGRYRRIGGVQDLLCEARIVSSSNTNLTGLVADGRFRDDLYYRLNGIELHIPPLRARREDIVPVAEHYLVQFARSAGYRVPVLAPAAISVMEDHHWPGNVWELRHRLERAVSLAGDVPQLGVQVIFPEQILHAEPTERVASLAEARHRAERLHIEEAIRRTGGEIGKTASLLGISRTTLWDKMRRLGIN